MPTRFRGADKHIRRLKAMGGPRIEREARKLVYALADEHVDRASYLITQGAVSGLNHVPSLPGEPPNEDTGTLRISGHVEQTGPFSASSVFDAEYALPLEFGTSKMQERPFARPAANDIRKKVPELAAKAKIKIIGGGTI